MEVIEQLKGKIQIYMNTNSRDWSNFALWIDKMEFQNAVHLVVAMERKCALLEMMYLSKYLLQKIVLIGKTGVVDGQGETLSCAI